MTGSHHDELVRLLREATVLASACHLMSWDQETMMPPAAAPARAEALALVSKLAHRRFIDPRIGERLAECEADPALAADERMAANLREIRRDYDRARKLPAELVAEMNRVGSQAVEAWKAARRDRDYELFRPWLEKQIDLNRRKADCLGSPPGGGPYDALLEDYEPGMTAGRLDAIFAPLRSELVPLIEAITATGYQPGRAPQELKIPRALQHELSMTMMKRVGLDPRASRLDSSTHPFSSSIAPGDLRITTRYRDDWFTDALGSTLHEAGHALYEQGLPRDDWWGQPLGEPLGLGIHESQSRLWENHVGRSRAFWEWALPVARGIIGPALDPFTADDLYRSVNGVRPHPIRVESDEATYNLHVLLRFDLERALLSGDLSCRDLPGAWNERMRSDLGLEVAHDGEGCLQDIHWAGGAVAYFPTYTLGSLYAAQFWEALRGEIDGLEGRLARGEFGALREWLQEKIHAHGRRYPAEELCRRITGRPLDHRALIRHLQAKFTAIYDLS
jgi:carboxypeptidase Taq